MHVEVTSTPTAIPGLTADTTYFLRNRGANLVWIEVAGTAPDRDSLNAFPIYPGADFYPRPEGVESIWLWTDENESLIVYLEAA